jgi:tRNA (cmo5U34)-methyltransferase
MNKKGNDFDPIAPWYDLLVKIVFGKSMKHAQEFFLARFPQQGCVLVLGGGTGWIVNSLLKLRPHIHVTYIEASAKMIGIAKQKLNENENRVTFIHGTERNIPAEVLYDGVITNFFLDLFPQEYLPHLIQQIKKTMKPRALWIVTDFVTEKWWQKVFVKTMYWFFIVTTSIQATQMPRWRQAMVNNGLDEMASASFYGGFMVTKLYQVTE